MKPKTHYRSEFSLSVLKRPVLAPGGQAGWELQWIHSADVCGLAVYVSALDAEIARSYRVAEGEKSWQRGALEEFDALELIPEQSDVLHCMVVFGLTATQAQRLFVVDGRLQPIYIPVRFAGLSGADGPVTLDFAPGIFSFLREQWESIGASSHDAQITQTNRESSLRLTDLASHALRTGSLSADGVYGDSWGVFQPNARAWRFGAANERVVV